MALCTSLCSLVSSGNGRVAVGDPRAHRDHEERRLGGRTRRRLRPLPGMPPAFARSARSRSRPGPESSAGCVRRLRAPGRPSRSRPHRIWDRPPRRHRTRSSNRKSTQRQSLSTPSFSLFLSLSFSAPAAVRARPAVDGSGTGALSRAMDRAPTRRPDTAASASAAPISAARLGPTISARHVTGRVRAQEMRRRVARCRYHAASHGREASSAARISVMEGEPRCRWSR